MDIEPVEEILTEPPLGHFRLEIAVRRGHDACIHVDRLARAESGDLPFLEDTQQLRLRGWREIADFVEEQRAAAGCLERSLAGRIGAGERAPLMAKELALHQLVRQRGAVQRDKWGFGVGAQAMEFAGDQLLARSALTNDERGTGYRSDTDDHFLELLERRARPDQRRFQAEAAAQQRDLRVQPALGDRVLD